MEKKNIFRVAYERLIESREREAKREYARYRNSVGKTHNRID